ncbi:MAG TPA: DUF1800 family protein [Acidobacteriaceae bacterium]|nr:DUF1800 family protein [Acidobacteriaceae bacterium]
MPTNLVCASQRCLVAALAALLVLPPCEPVAFARRKKKEQPTAAGQSSLTQDQRVLQALNRLTFGPRPGDVAAVEAMGLDQWINQQLNPETIDDSALNARLAAYPAMQLSPHDLVARFPSPAMIRQAELGKRGLPWNPVERAIYQDQIADLRARQEKKAENQAQNRAQNAAPGTGTRAQSAAPGTEDRAPGAGQAPAGGSSDAMKAQADDMAPPPPPDMMPAAASAKPPEPSLDEQENRLYADLDATNVVNLPPDQRVKKLVAMQPDEFRDFLQHMNRPDRVALFADLTPEQKETVFALINPQLVVGGELLVTRVLRDVYSERQLQAVMADFWLNHFNVYLRKGEFAPWYLVDYQNRVILPHALGKFEDLLVATAQSPAMLFYLDQTESVGPHSLAAWRSEMGMNGPAAKQRQLGINENYARELMELHTLGVNGGYTQRDVIEVAKIFTGWGIERPDEGGDFVFNPRRHEPGQKVALGHEFAYSGESEGLQVLHLLANSPVTAHHVSFQIAQRFVSDNPPPALVDAMAATWVKTGGDIREVLRTMLARPEFWSQETYRAKVKTPEEYVISAVRATGGNVVHPAALVEAIGQLGMPLYGCQTPNGYAWTADAWLNSGELLDRMNFSLALADNNAGTQMDWDKLMGIDGLATLAPDAKEAKLENVLLDGVVSEHTRAAALAELDQQQNAPEGRARMARPVNFVRPREFGQLLQSAAPLAPPEDQQAALLGGLLLGSPDFQRR